MPYEFCEDPTDARYISVGLAQWNQDEVSLKLMRHIGTQWTRQAEELPLHRVIDMTVFLAKTLCDSGIGTIHLPKHTFDNQDDEIVISREERSRAEMMKYEAFLDANDEHLKQRLRVLADVLAELKEKGKL